MIPSPPAILTDHLGTKIVALLLALVVYLHVYTEQEQEKHLRVPVHVHGLDPNLVLVTDPPRDIGVTLRGQGKQLLKMNYFQNPSLDLDLTEMRPGEIQCRLSSDDVNLPVGMEAQITGIDEPRVVTIRVDTLIERSLRVEVPMLGDLPDDLAWLSPAKIVPATVTARGPASRVGEMQEIVTEPLHLDEVTQREVRTLTLGLDMDQVTVDPKEVRVVLPVAPVVHRDIANRPVSLVGLGRNLQGIVIPDSASIRLAGPESLLDEVDPTRILLMVDAEGLGAGRHQLAPKISLPYENTRVIGVDPPLFDVVIRPVPR